MSTTAYSLLRSATDEERSKIEQVSRSIFYIHQQPESIREAFYFPKLLYWSGSYVIQRMCHGLITDNDGVLYSVVFHDGLTRGEILTAQSAQYALSFREPKEQFKLVNIVLIKRSSPK